MIVKIFITIAILCATVLVFLSCADDKKGVPEWVHMVCGSAAILLIADVVVFLLWAVWSA